MKLAANNIWGIVLLALFIITLVPFTILLYLRRNHPYLKVRSPVLILCGQVVGVIVSPVLEDLVLALYPLVPCQVIYWFAYFIFNMYAFPLLLRVWIFVYQYRTTMYRADMEIKPSASELSIAESSKNESAFKRFQNRVDLWLIHNKWVVSDRFLLKTWFIGIPLQLIPPAVIHGLFYRRVGGGSSTVNLCVTIPGVFEYTIVLGLLYVSVAIFFCYILKTAQDAYYLKKEYRIISAVWLTMLVVWIVWSIYPSLSKTIPGFLWPSFATLVTLCVDGYYIFYKIETEEKQLPKQEGNDDGEVAVEGTLAELLKNPSFKRKFYKYLILQFCPENLLFWDAVKEWQSSAGSFGKAKDIYDKYIAPGSSDEINISYATCRPISEFFQNNSSDTVPTTIFDKAVVEVERLMETDSLQRFKGWQKTQRQSMSISVVV
eukprot:TRINITY_DN12570_c0_g1_i1.p1 TRINITY_DN12570_c0_g1~~TRINITY_DN12570_c0_g1_i1.p1  ORF type:complete len:432 (+),score=55.78 TRINITY_DN12570_c0_g1_i1:44-1339(+)